MTISPTPQPEDEADRSLGKTLPPEAVVFDLDGLLFNTEELYPLVAGEVLSRRGKRYTEELHQQMMGRPAHISLQLMINSCQLLNDTVEGLRAECTDIFQDLLNERLALMTGVQPLLDCVDRLGHPKAVATSSGRAFAEDILSRFDLLGRFEFLLCSEDVTEGKPHPEIYLTASDQLGVLPSRVLVLEDSPHGFAAARAAGTLAVAVPGPHNAHLRHSGCYDGATLVVDSLAAAELYHLLGVVPPASFNDS